MVDLHAGYGWICCCICRFWWHCVNFGSARSWRCCFVMVLLRGVGAVLCWCNCICIEQECR
jgi:hypothetical protein